MVEPSLAVDNGKSHASFHRNARLPETDDAGFEPRIGNGEYIYPQIPVLTF